MIYKSIETGKGILKYRMPNLIEAYMLLDASGITSGEKITTVGMKKNVIVAMEPIIDYSGIEGAFKYIDLFDMVDEMIIPLGDIADEVIIKTFDAFKKKSS